MNSAAVPVIELLVPVFNEEPVIESHLQEILKRAAPEAPADYRLKLLVIDDGSSDGTREALDRFCAGEPRARYLSFTRNFGKESAISAGLDQVSDDADAAILMDSDLQHPPELVPRMVKLWRAGSKIVEARKSSRGRESMASRLFAAGFYRLFRLLAKLDLQGQSDFKLLDRAVVAQYRSLHERGRFFRGLVQWMGYPAAHISFEVPERAGGNSRWSRLKLLRYALHNITAFSATPLQFISWCGLISILVGVVFGALAFVQKIRGEALDGFTTVILLLIFFSGALMLSLGVIGHYLARIYEEIKHRPGYILRSDEPAAQGNGPRKGNS